MEQEVQGKRKGYKWAFASLNRGTTRSAAINAEVVAVNDCLSHACNVYYLPLIDIRLLDTLATPKGVPKLMLLLYIEG